jgi:hypothetical protein
VGADRTRQPEVDRTGDVPARTPRAQEADRARRLAALQRSVGNRATTAFVQRWVVPGDLRCSEVVPYMRSSSPYAPEWAATASSHTFEGGVNVRHTTRRDGTVQSTARGHRDLNVTVDSPVDRPEWDPSPRPNRDAEVAAWQRMRRALDAHESEHQRIGRTNNADLIRRWRAVNMTVTGSDAETNMSTLTDRIQTAQEGWMATAQARQSRIDPFRGANLACPPRVAEADTAD